MRSPIANWRENLQKIAHAVHEDDDDGIYSQDGADEYSSVSDRRNSHSFAHSKSASRSPVPNGFDTPLNLEFEHYKAEIRRLQESESEIKALSVNYAALLKEKEDQISRLNKENGALRQNLEATSAAFNRLRNESMRTSPNNSNVLKESGNLSPNRQSKFASPMKGRVGGNQGNNGFFSKEDLTNGNRLQQDYLQAREKELADLLEEKTRLVASLEASHESKIREMKMELEKERKNSATVKTKFQEEHRLNESFQEEFQTLKEDKKKTDMEMSQMRNELNERISEMRRLQLEMSRQDGKNTNGIVESLKREMANLQKENEKLRMEKDSVESSLKISRNSSAVKVHPSSLTEDGSLESFPGRELEQSLKKLEKDLKEACRDRDKAVRELNRLKQHLLEKESEESEKMDEDTKIIEKLREINEHQKAQISHLDKALKQALADQNEFRMSSNSEIQKNKETINDLNRKLANCMSTIDAKNMELLNLQTALGQYYAEIEAKEHLERDLTLAREESAKLSELLKGADKLAEASKKEKEEILAKLSLAEKTAIEGSDRLHKLEEDNAKLRRALEQSMTRLNRMSMDSDYLVDRRIVIKLLVTYFQRNHSKEVLDLMVRMLGFSDEDKQRIGGARQGAGKGVVKGVLGIPGRLVGGILGGGSAEAHANVASDDQSFADLWVDFLLKESDERERRDRAEGIAGSSGEKGGRSPSAAAGAGSPLPANSMGMTAAGGGTDTMRTFPRFNSPMNHESSRLFHGNTRETEPYGSEFSTVPLSSERTSRPLR